MGEIYQPVIPMSRRVSTIGYLDKETQKRETEKLKIQERYQRAVIKRQKLQAKIEKASAKKTKKFANDFMKQFTQIAKSVKSNQLQQKQVQIAQPYIPPEMRQRPQKKWNPFAHDDPMEVYGDDGLTFFDSNKRASPNEDNTGAFFGI